MPEEKVVYMLRNSEKQGSVQLSMDDCELLRIYSSMRHCSQRQCAHEMLVAAIKCWEEHHLDKIQDITDDLKDCKKKANSLARIGDTLRKRCFKLMMLVPQRIKMDDIDKMPDPPTT